MKNFIIMFFVVLLAGCQSPQDSMTSSRVSLVGDYYGKNEDGEVHLSVVEIAEGTYSITGTTFGEALEKNVVYTPMGSEEIKNVIGVDINSGKEVVLGTESLPLIFGKIDPAKTLIPTSGFQETGYGALSQDGDGYFAAVFVSLVEMKKL